MKWGNMVYPKPDEFALSYMMRLGLANGIDNYKDLVLIFLDPILQKRRYIEKINVERGMFFQLLDADASPETLLNALLDNTTFAFDSIFLNKTCQMDYCNAFFRRYKEESLFRTFSLFTTHLLVKTPKYCPLCAKEEFEKNGSWSLHTTHQLAGVNICTKHRCELVPIDIADFSPVTLPEINCINAVSDIIDCNYAEFATALYNLRLDTDGHTLQTVIKRRVKELNNLANGACEQHCRLRLNNYLHRSIPVMDTVFHLMSLFDSASQITSYLPYKETDYEFYSKRLNELGFSCLTSLKIHSPIIVRHNSCGHVFVTTAHSLISGWGCPQCNLSKSDDEIIKQLVHTASFGQHKLESISKDRLIVRDVQNRIHNCTLKHYLLRQGFFLKERRNAQTLRLIYTGKISPDFEMMDPYIAENVPIKCRCKICNQESYILPRNLIKGSYCKNWISNKEHDYYKRHFADVSRKIKEINPDITLLEYQGATVINKFKCEKCGREWSEYIESFKRRKLCKYNHLHLDVIQEQIRKISPNITVVEMISSNDESKILQRKSLMKVRCDICGTEWKTKLGSLYSGCVCPTKHQHTKTDKSKKFTIGL